jgi:hypothetical protein
MNTGTALERLPGREVRNGIHEVKELGPALRHSLVGAGLSEDAVVLGEHLQMSNWNRPTSQVDLVMYAPGRRVRSVVELKAWDIGHQLFDLAKVCCLLDAGVSGAFLICVAKQAGDFGRMPGGELFPSSEGETRKHRFTDLISRHRNEWRHHVGRGRPEPTSVPTAVSTTAIAVDIEIQAYPGHSARAVAVSVLAQAPVSLIEGWPDGIAPAG